METLLAYGKKGLPIELDEAWNVSIVAPRHAPACSDQEGALLEALRHPIGSAPLRKLARSGQRIGIVFSDITRPTPNHLLIPALLSELDHLPPDSIQLFNALGTHRANTSAELEQMLGKGVVDRFRVIQNAAFDPGTQVHLGTTRRGHDIWLNRELVECDLKILTGFIEPHFFAGFSGGGKAIMPGMAGLRTVLGNHDAGMVSSPRATWGETEGNPIWEEIQEVASRVEPGFLLNVTLEREKRITRVFAGDWRVAHRSGCEFVRQTAMVPVAGEFDIVITTNSGYPLDLNLYQTVKGMSAAAQIVKAGGAIIAASECWDGIPEHGLYRQLLREAGNPPAVLKMVCAPGFLKQDQWQAQIQAQIQQKADVYLYSESLSDAQIEEALLRPCRSIEKTVSGLLRTYGSDALICVLPEGPQTIPYVV